MSFKYKLVYNVVVDADDKEEADDKIELFFNGLYDSEDEDISIIDDSDYYFLSV